MSLPSKDSAGRIYVAPAGIPFRSNSGLAYNAAGQLCTTTTLGPNDVYLGGFRVATTGHLVVGDGVPEARPYVMKSGLPFDKRNGAMIRQMDVVPAPGDPFVAGVRVGALGGVYATTDVPPARR